MSDAKEGPRLVAAAQPLFLGGGLWRLHHLQVLRILNVPITDTSLRPFAAPLLRACATDAVCADLQPNAVNPLPPTFWNARGFDLQYKLQSSWKTMAHESRSLKCELKEFWQGTDYGTHIEEEGVCNLTCAPYEGPDRAKLYVEIALETAGVVPAIVIQGILPRSLRLFLEVFVAFWLMYFTQQFRHSHRHVPAALEPAPAVSEGESFA